MSNEIVGNAHSDRNLMDECHDIIMNESLSMTDRIAGCRRLDEIMGVDVETVNEEDVQSYVNDFS